jgi:hypothetical protein
VKLSPENVVPAGALTISHEDIVAEYQRRLTALTHENIMLGIALQQARQGLAGAPLREADARQAIIDSGSAPKAD